MLWFMQRISALQLRQSHKERTTAIIPLNINSTAKKSMPEIARSPGHKSLFVFYFRHRYKDRNGKAREHMFFSANMELTRR